MEAGLSDLEGVSFAEAAKSSRGTTVRNLLEAGAPAAEFSRLLNSAAGNNHPRAGIITSPAEKTGFRPSFKGHAYFSFHASPRKAKSLSAHLFVTHPNTEAAEDTPIIFHRKADVEDSHARGDVLGQLHIGGAGHQELG